MKREEKSQGKSKLFFKKILSFKNLLFLLHFTGCFYCWKELKTFFLYLKSKNGWEEIRMEHKSFH